jgi:beta-lactam-binding protein with PASTA domain
MGFIKSSVSALGKLFFVGLLAAAFIVGMAGVVYMSLQGNEIQVPEIVGKNFSESETQLASLGLKIKKRADRYSTEPPNTILEQLPRPGDTVKTGQMILVVTSKQNADSGETPATLNKNTNEQDDTEKIEEMISDKPKKPKANANTNLSKKKTRDVLSNTATDGSNSDTNSTGDDSNKRESGSNNSSEKTNKTPATPANKQTPGGTKTNTMRSTGGDTRPRTTTKP